MAECSPGQSAKPPARRRPKRLSDEHMVTRLTRAIAREKVEFKDSDGPLFDDQAQRATYTRIEWIVRVLFDAAAKANLGAARLIAEIAEGKLARQVGDAGESEERVQLTDEQMAELLAIALARLEEWRAETPR